jgi:hypothetical protein
MNISFIIDIHPVIDTSGRLTCALRFLISSWSGVKRPLPLKASLTIVLTQFFNPAPQHIAVDGLISGYFGLLIALIYTTANAHFNSPN